MLWLKLDRAAIVRVGKLGKYTFPRGWYAYAGSARGPGGLRARVARHLRRGARSHWHVDYLREISQPAKVHWQVGGQRRECAVASAVGRLHGAQIVAPRFGASDCSCSTHLWYFEQRPPGGFGLTDEITLPGL